MPPQQGEVSLLTLFADVHYYFSPPTYKPPHHRFDKGSYVYLYHNPMQQRGRIEVANHAGTPEQDAFAGHLDAVKIEQTYKHPCLFTFTVDSFRSTNGSARPSPQQQDMSQWHLPVPDPNNQGKYMYKIHTLDVYFWTADDAGLFLDSLRRVVQPHQLHIVSNSHSVSPPAEHKNDVLNPVVAKLEKAAISHSSRSPSISTTQSLPGPPSAPAPTAGPPADVNYQPMAYNPAAPAAPEPIAHREKTPPPPDAADGTGLNAAAHHEHGAPQYTNPLQTSFAPQSTSQPYMPGPPSRTSTFAGPPNPSVQRTNTTGSIPPPPQSPPAFAPPPAGPPPGSYDPQPGLQRQSTAPVQQYATYANSPGFPPAMQSPNATSHSPIPSPGYRPQNYQPLASPPPGGYAQFQYSSTGGGPNAAVQSAGTPDPYSTHQQLYRPTEQEASTHEHSAPAKSNIGKKAEKVEKGVGRFLKKLDKKL